MAIQKINLGTEPLGEGGDTYRSANTKINENFSNPDHGASRIVVGTVGGLVDWKTGFQGQATVGGTGWGGAALEIAGRTTDEEIYQHLSNKGSCIFRAVADTARLYDRGPSLYIKSQATHATVSIDYRTGGVKVATGAVAAESEAPNKVATLYSDLNTRIDSRSNLLMASGTSIPTDSAASRLVGTEKGQLAEWTTYNGIAGTGIGGRAANVPSSTTGNRIKQPDIPYESGFYTKAGPLDAPVILGLTWQQVYVKSNDSTGAMLVFTGDSRDKSLYLAQKHQGEFGEWIKFYGTGNTKLDTNGAIAPSSPTIDLYSDRIEPNDDGERMNPEFVRNGVGDYTIKNTTGLRDEGWYIKIPNDMNGNPKVAVSIDTDKDGNLNIKTYKRTFSLETFTFGPDLNEPLDIPEGRWIDLRFNDLPVEELYEPEPVEDPTVDEAVEPEAVEESTEEPE